MAEKPTIGDIIKLKDDRVTYYSTLRTEQESSESYYELEFDSGIKEPFREIKMDTARNFVDDPVNTMVTDNPQIKYPPLADTEVERERAQKVQNVLQAGLDRVLQEQPNPLEEAPKNIWLYGEGYFKALVNKEVYDTKPKKGEKNYDEELEEWEYGLIDNFPLILKAPNPRWIMPSIKHSRGIPANVIEFYKRRVEDIKANYPDWVNAKDKKDTELVDWIEYWSKDWRGYLADGVSVFGEEKDFLPNIFEIVPYVHMYSGLGRMSADGDPKYMARSVLFGAKDMLLTETRGFSQIDTIRARYAYPIVKAQGRKDAYESAPIPEPGAILYGVNDTDNTNVEIDYGANIPASLFVRLY